MELGPPLPPALHDWTTAIRAEGAAAAVMTAEAAANPKPLPQACLPWASPAAKSAETDTAAATKGASSGREDPSGPFAATASPPCCTGLLSCGLSAADTAGSPAPPPRGIRLLSCGRSAADNAGSPAPLPRGIVSLAGSADMAAAAAGGAGGGSGTGLASGTIVLLPCCAEPMGPGAALSSSGPAGASCRNC